MKRNNLQGQVVALETEKLHLENKIERLNNIINELEKWLKEEIDCYDSIEKGVIKFTYCDIMDKLQELKGSEKE